jgi:NDP-sugar pyrophosphorylase family protein
MAPVGGRPFLEYLLGWLHSAAITELILCVGYKRKQIQNWLGNGSQRGFRVRYSVEEELRGTAGALRLAAKMVNAPTCVALNGDSFLEVNLREMYRFHQSKRAIATIALARVRDSARYGGLQLDRKERITGFFEKGEGLVRHPPGHGGFQLISGGVYLLQRRFLSSIPAGETVSLEKETFPTLAGGRLYGFVTHGFFIDIGIPADYARAQTELPKRFSI